MYDRQAHAECDMDNLHHVWRDVTTEPVGRLLNGSDLSPTSPRRIEVCCLCATGRYRYPAASEYGLGIMHANVFAGPTFIVPRAYLWRD